MELGIDGEDWDIGLMVGGEGRDTELGIGVGEVGI